MMVPAETDFVLVFWLCLRAILVIFFSCISSWIGGRLGGSKATVATESHALRCSAGFTFVLSVALLDLVHGFTRMCRFGKCHAVLP